MLFRAKFYLLLFLLSLGFSHQAHAANKYALLVGINNYSAIPSLAKAEGDARKMAAVLQQLGFEIDLVLNPNRRALNKAVSAFRAKLKPGDTAFFHYSGHGVEINGRNYLLPADIPKPTTAAQDEIEGEALSVASIINRVASTGAGARIFVLDACRDNPFAQSGTRGIGSTRGLSKEESSAGTFVFYSAGYGQAALDSLGAQDPEPTSVYTRVLANQLLLPHKHIANIARNVRRQVEKLAINVGHIQRPAYYDELSNDFCLVCGQQPNDGQSLPGGTSQPTQPTGPSAAQSGNTHSADLVIRSVELKSTGQCKSRRPVMNGRIEVENIGTGPAGTQNKPVIVNIRSTHEASRSWSNGTQLGIIPPGEKRVGYFPLFYYAKNPQHIHGLHEFEVTVDSKNTVKELNEQNNKAYGEVELNCRKTQVSNNKTSSPAQRAKALPRGGPKSYWDHNGSLMYLKSDGIKRAFYYQSPKRGLNLLGIREGTLLFHGKYAGGNYIGKMRMFSRICGTVEFDVRGLAGKIGQTIRVEVSGNAPVRNLRNCQISGYKKRKFIFTYLYNASPKARKKLNDVVKQVPDFKSGNDQFKFQPGTGPGLFPAPRPLKQRPNLSPGPENIKRPFNRHLRRENKNGWRPDRRSRSRYLRQPLPVSNPFEQTQKKLP